MRANITLPNTILHGKAEGKEHEGSSQDSGWSQSPLDDVKEWIGLNSNDNYVKRARGTCGMAKVC